MAKKWQDVIASPDYQSLNSQEKADAQSQYFNEVVKPQLKPDEVSEAHDQFYSQYPVGTDKATQTAKDIDTQLADVHEQLGRLGSNGELARTDTSAGNQMTNYLSPNYERPLHQLKQDVAQPFMDEAGKLVGSEKYQGLTQPQVAAKLAEPAMARNTAIGVSLPLTAPIAAVSLPGMVATQAAIGGGTELLGQAAESAISGENRFDAGDVLKQTAYGGLFGVGGYAAGKGIEYGYDAYRNLAPEILGGYSDVQQAARVVDPEYINQVLQEGDVSAQNAFRNATTNDLGESILTPSQTMNTEGGAKYIRAENRDLTRGDRAYYAPNIAEQKTGDSFARAINDVGESPEIQETAQKLSAAHKERVNRLYNTSKDQAQEVLDSAPVKITELKFPDTRSLADMHLNQSAESGNVLLTADARKTLNGFNKATISDINSLDQWKRTLSEKAQKAYKAGDMDSYRALNQVKNSLRDEADEVIHSISPEAGSIYSDADRYFAGTVDGYGKKSELQKILNSEFGETAGNKLFTPVTGELRTEKLFNQLNESGKGQTFDAATQYKNELATAIAGEARQRALNYANTGEHFSPTKMYTGLKNTEGTVLTVDPYSPRNNWNIHDALMDAASRLKTSNAASVGKGVTPTAANVAGRVVGGGVGAAVGGGVVGGLVGQEVGGRVGSSIASGLIDRLKGTNIKATKYINYLSDPVNAAKVQDVLSAEGGLDAPLKSVTSTIDALTRTATAATSTKGEKKPAYTSPVKPLQNEVNEPEPVQQAQSARRLNTTQADEFEPNVTRFYRALAHAETGNLQNRFIRTKAKDKSSNLPSTAYGPAQIVVSTMDDFYKRHSNLFTPEEKEYIKRFHEQGVRMRNADDNDPVYGYGGTGILNSAADKKLYARVARKMIGQMLNENKGDMTKTMHQWRGNDKDKAYFHRVNTAYQYF